MVQAASFLHPALRCLVHVFANMFRQAFTEQVASLLKHGSDATPASSRDLYSRRFVYSTIRAQLGCRETISFTAQGGLPMRNRLRSPSTFNAERRQEQTTGSLSNGVHN